MGWTAEEILQRNRYDLIEIEKMIEEEIARTYTLIGSTKEATINKKTELEFVLCIYKTQHEKLCQILYKLRMIGSYLDFSEQFYAELEPTEKELESEIVEL